MGKLHQIGNTAIRVYANDHLPPHVHIVGPDEEALIEIETLAVMRGAVSSRSGRIALAWAVRNKVMLAAEWNRINPRFPIA